MIFEPREAIQINLILSLVISTALILKIRKDVDIGIVKRFIVGSLPGLPLGIVVFLIADTGKLKFGISIVILTLTLLLILNFRLKKDGTTGLCRRRIIWCTHDRNWYARPTTFALLFRYRNEKETLRATTLAFYLFIYSTSLLIQVLFAGTSKIVWASSLAALPLVFVGLFVGQILFHHVNQKYFRILTYCILLFTGIYLLVQ